MDLWSLAGNHFASNLYSDLTAGNVINPYAYLNSGQSLLSGSGAFAQQLSRYGQFYGNNSLQSVVRVIEKDPELKEKVTDTLKDIYQAMASSGDGQALQRTGEQVAHSATRTAGSARSDHVQVGATRVSSAQASSAYKQQMGMSRRTPAMHAATKFSG